jgi:hypothetical protein
MITKLSRLPRLVILSTVATARDKIGMVVEEDFNAVAAVSV